MNKKKLNIGCGTNYRDGFINIDGSNTLENVDKVIQIGTDSLLNYFEKESIDYILANDIIEHFFHWEAVELLKSFFELLKNKGEVEIRVPDTELIINSNFSIEEKLVYLYGGQDIPQGHDSEMDKSRKKHPEFFCHKYGWTKARMKDDLKKIGFKNIKFSPSGTNVVIFASKNNRPW